MRDQVGSSFLVTPGKQMSTITIKQEECYPSNQTMLSRHRTHLRRGRLGSQPGILFDLISKKKWAWACREGRRSQGVRLSEEQFQKVLRKAVHVTELQCWAGLRPGNGLRNSGWKGRWNGPLKGSYAGQVSFLLHLVENTFSTYVLSVHRPIIPATGEAETGFEVLGLSDHRGSSRLTWAT